ncbi:MAG: NAD-dependent protein deacylase [Oscillospiraceae bacterium]|jgi:NAD-dependent deacetylase|nr:NAD-dependent protein deacylase [Oscillospiraceae bacterium]
MDAIIEKLRGMIAGSGNIVFFGGAGVSTESGIPDFRGTDGLYTQKYKYPPEKILSGSFFRQYPEAFYEYCRDKLTLGGARPNRAHLRLAELEKEGRLRAVVTQNIDGLHQAAGSVNVWELHGSLHRFYCVSCGREMPEAEALSAAGVPRCEDCGGVVRPDVVLYEEALNARVIAGAVRCLSEADLLIVGGSSLNVYPAAGLINYYRGDKLVLINRQPTPYDGRAKLVINAKLGEVFAQV